MLGFCSENFSRLFILKSGVSASSEAEVEYRLEYFSCQVPWKWEAGVGGGGGVSKENKREKNKTKQKTKTKRRSGVGGKVEKNVYKNGEQQEGQ